MLNETNNNFFSKSIVKELQLSLIEKKEKLANFLNFMQKILKNSSHDKSLDKPICIYNFFEEIGILVELNDDILFIIQCYFLTKYAMRDKDEIPIAINYEKICCDFNISHTQAKHLIHKSQRDVA